MDGYFSADGLPPFGGGDLNDEWERRSWQAVDTEPVLDGTWKPAAPTVGRRLDGIGMFYPGKCHTISSESEAGKTWFALSACLDEIKAGNHVLYIDFEDDVGGVVNRLLVMGADRSDIRERFTYLRPLDPIGKGINRDDLNQILGDLKPTLGIIDGITEALAIHGFDANKNNEVADFGLLLPRYIAKTGTAVASLDHVVKNGENRGRYSIGAVHKLNGLDGAAYVLENRKPFGIGLRGVSTVRISKDRPGQLRRHGLPSSGGLHWYADLIVDSKDEDYAEVTVEAPVERSEDWRPTDLMAKIAAELDKRGALSKNKIEIAIKGKAQSIRDALDYLILDGYVSDRTPHELLKPYIPGSHST